MKDPGKWKYKRPQPIPATPSGELKRRLALSVLLLVTAGATWALFEFVIWNKVPAALVGKWVVTTGPDQGGLIDIHRNGNMIATVDLKNQERIIHARIRVDDKKIYVTTKHLRTGEEGTRVQTIKLLDRTHLTLEDERGASIQLERAETSE